MARPSPEFAVTLSVLDRLIDNDPKNPRKRSSPARNRCGN